MALSPQYGWSEPDNSSLVKNGAADIRTLGDAIDTSVWNVGFGQAGKNKVINGNFGIWQRGTSFTVTSATFTADRFFSTRDGNGTVTASQQTFTAGSAPVAGYEGQYFLQLATTSVGTSTYHQTQQYIEDVRTFAGQTVTVSFWAKLSTGTIGSPYFRLNQNFGSGGSAQVAGSANNFTPTGSWQRFSATITLPSISGKTIGIGSNLALDIVVPFSVTNTLQIWGVQIEYGAKATPFQTATGTIQGELAACQRYYEKSYNTDVAPATTTDVGAIGMFQDASTSTLNQGQIFYKVTKRGTPTLTIYSPVGGATGVVYNNKSGANVAATALYNGASNGSFYTNVGTAGTGLNAKYHYVAELEL